VVPSNGWMRALLLDGNDVVKRLVLDTSAGVNSVIVVLRLRETSVRIRPSSFFLVILDRWRNDR